MTLENLKTMVEERKIAEITEKNTISLYPNGIGNFLNMSDINTLLIKQAAKHCDRFASDVIIDINAMEKKILELAESTIKGETAPATECLFFGFRDMGVDGATFIRSRIEGVDNCGKIGKYYKALYVAEISIGEPWGYYPSCVDAEVHLYGFEFAQYDDWEWEDEDEGKVREGNKGLLDDFLQDGKQRTANMPIVIMRKGGEENA